MNLFLLFSGKGDQLSV